MKKKLDIPHSIYVSILYTGRQAVCERGRKRTRGEREMGRERKGRRRESPSTAGELSITAGTAGTPAHGT